MTGSRPANPAIRRFAAAALLAVSVACILSIVCCLRIQSWIVADSQAMIHRIRIAIVLISALISLPLFAFSCYLWHLGAGIIRAQEFPPSGYWVLTDAPVIRGTKALFRGRAIKILGICFGAASILFGFLFWTMAESLLDGKV